MRRLLLLGALLVVLPTACGDAGATGEVAFDPYPGSRWLGADGQIVDSPEVINVIEGPRHCEWQSAAMLHVGWPLGHESRDIREARQYVRDPKGVLPTEPLRSTYDGDARLPSEAQPTGYRTEFMELWLGRNAREAAYLVFDDHVERWPRAEPAIACA